tara:strand:+ start:14638 stop:16671 length:2034 start_codon:yes stop_codon:yes gene_type:complete
MKNPSRKITEYTFKGIVELLIIILLINPVIIYLVSENLLFSILVPIFFIITLFLLRANKTIKPLSILLYNLMLILSFFLHAEAIFTTNFSEYIIDNLYDFGPNFYFNKPYLNKTFRDKEFLVQYKTNKQGFRIGIEDDPEIEVNRADWLFIGDSYTQGAQVQYESLYTSRLMDFFPNKIIVNSGISGLGIPDEYKYYVNQGKKLKSKKVFLQICNFNDFMNVKEHNFGFSDYLMQYSNFARFALYRFKYPNPAELPLGRWTEPFYPDEESNENYNIFFKSLSESKIQDIRNFEIYLKKIKKAVDENGAELIVIQIPTKEQVYYKYFNEVLRDFKIDVDKLDMDKPNKLLNEICQEIGIRHIDLLNDFRDSESELFFQFDEHLNVEGHNQIALSIKNIFEKDDPHLPSKLSDLNVGDRYPVFSSKDSNLLLFQSFRDGNMEIFKGDSILQNKNRLTWNNVDEIHPWFSPNDEEIVFTEGNQLNNKTNVVLLKLDGGDRTYITDDKSTFGAIPSFNHDGLKITYAEWKEDDDGYLTNPYIVIYDLVTKEKNVITSKDFECWRPIFSSDDEKIFFISKETDNQFDIYKYDIATGEKENMTNTPYDEWDPSISRDGELMVYSGYKNDNWDLFLYDLATRRSKQLTNSIGDEWDATFSPNGQYIFYSGVFGLQNGIFKIKFN